MPKRILEGDVVSDKMDKTVTVLVERRFAHPVYKKYVKRTDKYAAHDESNAFRIGDRVQIEECRPISKRKTWRVITTPPTGRPGKVLKKADEGQKNAPKKEAPAKEAAKDDVKDEQAAETKAKKAPAKKAAKKAAAKQTTKKKR